MWTATSPPAETQVHKSNTAIVSTEPLLGSEAAAAQMRISTAAEKKSTPLLFGFTNSSATMYANIQKAPQVCLSCWYRSMREYHGHLGLLQMEKKGIFVAARRIPRSTRAV